MLHELRASYVSDAASFLRSSRYPFRNAYGEKGLLKGNIMQVNVHATIRLPRKKSYTISRARSGVSCAQCGEPIVMPEWSEWVDSGYARHLWHCDTCDYSFETRVVFAAA